MEKNVANLVFVVTLDFCPCDSRGKRRKRFHIGILHHPEVPDREHEPLATKSIQGFFSRSRSAAHRLHPRQPSPLQTCARFRPHGAFPKRGRNETIHFPNTHRLPIIVVSFTVPPAIFVRESLSNRSPTKRQSALPCRRYLTTLHRGARHEFSECCCSCALGNRCADAIWHVSWASAQMV